jgi:hypothetical protein
MASRAGISGADEFWALMGILSAFGLLAFGSASEVLVDPAILPANVRRQSLFEQAVCQVEPIGDERPVGLGSATLASR